MRTGAGEVLTRLRDHGAISRADLSRMTGISSAGITKICTRLDAGGMIREREIATRPIGRPPVALSLVPDARHVLAVHLSAGRIQVASSNVMLEIGAPVYLDFDLADPVEDVIADATALARSVLDEGPGDRTTILGVGVGVPGSVDAAGRVNTHSILAGWRDVAVADAVEAALGLPTIVEHNATAIAMAEARYGAGRDARSILHLLLGKGLGAGFAQTGSATRCAPVEIGHVVVEPDGRPCRCGGRGCLERYLSDGPLRELAGAPGVASADLVAAAMRSDGWPRVYGYLLQALSTAITLLGPERVVLGGDFDTAPDAFLDALRRDLPPLVMPQQRTRLTIERTGLANPAGVQGAACVALEEFFYTSGPAAADRTVRQIRASRST